MQEWRKYRTCEGCSELFHHEDVDAHGNVLSEQWRCLQDGHVTKPYLAACPLWDGGEQHGDADHD